MLIILDIYSEMSAQNCFSISNKQINVSFSCVTTSANDDLNEEKEKATLTP